MKRVIIFLMMVVLLGTMTYGADLQKRDTASIQEVRNTIRIWATSISYVVPLIDFYNEGYLPKSNDIEEGLQKWIDNTVKQVELVEILEARIDSLSGEKRAEFRNALIDVIQGNVSRYEIIVNYNKYFKEYVQKHPSNN